MDSTLFIYFLCMASVLINYRLIQKSKSKLVIKLPFSGKTLNNTFLHTIFIFVMPTVILAIRNNVGTDSENYYNFFIEQSRQGVYETSYSGMEFMFRVVLKLLSEISTSSVILFGFFAFMTHYFVVRYIEQEKDEISVYYILLFYMACLYGMSFNIMRQSFAISLVIWAYSYYIQKNYKNFMIIIIVAAMFHKAAFVVALIGMVGVIDKKRYRQILSFGFVIAIVIVVAKYEEIIRYMGIYINYITYEDLHYSGILYTLEKLCFLIPIIMNRKIMTEGYMRLRWFVILDIALVIPMVYVEYFYRVSYYFLPIYGILAAHFLKKTNNKNWKYYYYVLAIGYFVVNFYILKNHNIFPYNTIFNKYEVI